MNQVKILNVTLDNITDRELLERLSREGGFVVTTNLDHVIKLQTNYNFYQAYQTADYRVCDSQILMYISRFLGNPIKQKITGADFFNFFYHGSQANPEIKMFLIAPSCNTLEKAQNKINQEVGREMVIGGYVPKFSFQEEEKYCLEIVDKINNSGATVLVMGVGATKSEEWIRKYKNKLTNIKIFLSVGAALEFEAGVKKRAPKWMRQIGLEWLHRLGAEPQRLWKRYLVDSLPFWWLIIQQKLKLYKNPFSKTNN